MTFHLNIWHACWAWHCLGQTQRSRSQFKVYDRWSKNVSFRPWMHVTRWCIHPNRQRAAPNTRRDRNSQLLLGCLSSSSCCSSRCDLKWGLSSCMKRKTIHNVSSDRLGGKNGELIKSNRFIVGISRCGNFSVRRWLDDMMPIMSRMRDDNTVTKRWL